MKKFNYAFNLTLKILLCVAIAICLAGLGWNIFNLTQYIYLGALKIIGYSLIVVMNLFLLCFALLILLNSYYIIDDKKVRCNFGLIRYGINLSQITQITYFVKKQKLVVYFGEDKLVLIVISPTEFERFSNQLIHLNSNVIYTVEREDFSSEK